MTRFHRFPDSESKGRIRKNRLSPDAVIRSQAGSLMIAMIVMIVIVGIFAVITLSVTGTGQHQAVLSTLDLNAYYAAESGMRYLAMKHRDQGNTGGQTDPDDRNADDEKAGVLQNFDGMTLDMPNGGGKFSYEVYAYWFMVVNDAGTCRLKLPGRVPPGFSMPSTGVLVKGDRVGNPVRLNYTGGSLSDNGVFTCNELPADVLADMVGTSFYPALVPSSNQGARSSALQVTCSNPNLFPPAGGQVEINSITTLSVMGHNGYIACYDYTTYDPLTRILTLHLPRDSVTYENKMTGISLDGTIHLKKNIKLRVVGNAGQGTSQSRQVIDYAVAIGDSAQVSPPEEFLFKASAESPDPPDLFAAPDKDPDVTEPSLSVKKTWITYTYEPATNQSSVYTVYALQMKNLLERTDGETNPFCHGTALYTDKDEIHSRWEAAGRHLGYDVQVKLSSSIYQNYQALGLEFRKKYVETSSEGIGLYQGYGLSFMKYYAPSIVYTDASRTFSKGEWIYYFNAMDQVDGVWKCGEGTLQPLARAQVDAVLPPPDSLSGQAGSGRLLLKNPTLERLPDMDCPCVPETFFAESDIIRDNNGDGIATAAVVDIAPGGFNDHIPDSLKPPGMGSWFHGNVQYTARYDIKTMDTLTGDDKNEEPRLLLVLWQQRVRNGTEERRWLACKDMTFDPHIQRDKINIYDGRVMHDATGLVVRVREVGSGSAKRNELSVFYSDGGFETGGRAKTPLKYDHGDDRMGYRGGFVSTDYHTPIGQAVWPPEDLSDWPLIFEDVDYFTHLEKPQGVPEAGRVHWDLLISESGTVESWDGDGQAVFEVKDDGRILLSDFTTPDSGSYRVNEIALSGQFDAARKYNYFSNGALTYISDIQFFDFGILFPGSVTSRGGFLHTMQQ